MREFPSIKDYREINKMNPRRLLYTFFIILLLAGCGKTSKSNTILLKINVSETVENQNEIVSKIYSDLAKLHKSGVPLREYMLNVESSVKEHEKESTSDWFYCTEADIYNGKYLKALTLRYIDFDMKDTWKKYACFSYYCDSLPNANSVKVFLSDESNKDVLSMFVGYWCPDFVSEEEMERNAEVAEVYGKFIIDHYGLDELLSCAARDHMKEWLIELGLPYSFEDKYAQLLDCFTYSEEAEYKLIIKTDQNLEFYAMPPQEDGSDVFLLRQFLYESHEMVDDLLHYIEREAPDYYERARNNLLSANERIYFDHTLLSALGGVTMSSEIRLGSYLTFAHEICHVIVPTVSDTAHQWRYEGFANYAGYARGNMSIDVLLSIEKEYLKDASANMQEYSDLYREYLEKLQKILYMEDCTYMDLLKLSAQTEMHPDYSEYFYSITDSYAATYYPIDDEENSKLSYSTATFFVQYLIENYSLHNFLQYCYDDVSFEEAFGTSFAEALETWKQEFSVSSVSVIMPMGTVLNTNTPNIPYHKWPLVSMKTRISKEF